MGKWLEFKVQNKTVAVDVANVIAVIEAIAWQKIPSDKGYLLGTVLFYGDLFSLVDMAQMLNLGQSDVQVSDLFILCHINGENLAILANQVVEVVKEESVKEILLPKALEAPLFGRAIQKNGEIIPILKLQSINTKVLI
jgi:chemotaxis signal transduction protein